LKRPTLTALTLALALGAAASLWSLSPATAQSDARAPSTPQSFDPATFSPESLFLSNADAVIAKLGVPTAVGGNNQALWFLYGREGGLKLLIQGKEGLCIAAEGKLPRAFKRTPPPAFEGVYSGQASKEFLRRKGMPKGFSLNNVALVLDYPDLGRVVISHGRAIFASKPK
jgi:hypothetical protein